MSTLPLTAMAGPQDRDDRARSTDERSTDQQRDWSNNSYYSMGQRDAEADRSQNKQRHHKHSFRRDEDRQAYQSGYQSAWSGNGYRNNNNGYRNDNNGYRNDNQRHDDNQRRDDNQRQNDNQRHDDDNPHQ